MSLNKDGGGEEDEVCPVCKSSRYLNPDMRFLINPECYHKMCESCVDRIFSAGPAPCPIAGCRRTLRKHRFRTQTFDDISVEREIDIRRRVMQILNRREEEFESKRAYDDFLQQREEIIANLNTNTNVAETESQLKAYAETHKALIQANRALEKQESESFLQSQTLEQEKIRQRREAARQDYDNERKAIQADREDYLSRLAAGSADQAEAIAREGNRVLLKKSSARRSEEDRIKRKQAALLSESKKAQAAAAAAEVGAGIAPGAGLIKGLKKIKTPEPEKPYDPFGGLDLEKRDYYTLQQQYPSTYLDPVRNDERMLAGGYDLKEYYARTLLEAFAGLGCFVDEEAAGRNPAGPLNASMKASPTGLAASAAKNSRVPAAAIADDDVF